MTGTLSFFLLLLRLLLQPVTVSLSPSLRSFTIDYANNQFLKDGKPFRYISGGMHYFRVPSQYWEDRLYKLRKGGMNAVQSYVAWNLHEPFKGDFRFSGDNDVVKFIRIAQENDLLVILRVGPFICAEWEYGGLPYWIMKDMRPSQVRTKSEAYLKLVDNWISVLSLKVKPLLYSNGGPIISVQVEDGYGGFGNDHVYLRRLEAIFRKYLGDDIILFTSNVAEDSYLSNGTIPSLYTAIEFGASGDTLNFFRVQRKYQPQGPLVISEYYTGWLDHWGDKHNRVSGKTVAKTLDEILAFNASVNLYMFIGGTNFGFMNGANYREHLRPVPTSYDYDAPLTEAGDVTEKYILIRKSISKYQRIPPGPVPKPAKKGVYGVIKAHKTISLYKLLGQFKPVENQKPLSFETMDFPYGYVLYRTYIQGMFSGHAVLTMKKVQDRAVVLVDGLKQGITYTSNSTITLKEGSILDILVENQGRVNYGSQMKDTAKGILDDVTVNDYLVVNWQMYAINKTVMLSNIKEGMNAYTDSRPPVESIVSPCVTYFSFDVREKLDTFLKLDAWTKGVALVNGFNLGRYWTTAGPQRTLYVPRYMLKDHNTLILFETDALPISPAKRIVEFVDKPIWTN